jgi:ATP-binding cassette subfamily C exporter for protease/lipase
MPQTWTLLLRDIIKKRKNTLWGIAFFSSVINILAIAPSIYMLQVYDRVLQSRNEITLLMLSIIIIVIFCVSALLDYIRSMIAIHASKEIDRDLSEAVFNAEYQQRLSHPQLSGSNALSDVTSLRQFLTGNALFSFFDAPWFPVYIFIIFMFNVWLGVFSLVGAVMLLALAIVNEKLTHKPLQDAATDARKANWLASSYIRQADVIEAMGMSEALRQRWQTVQKSFIDHQQQASASNTAISSGTRFIRMTLQSMILGLGALLVIEGQMTPGMMIAGSILLSRALSPIEQVIGVWKQWKSARGALERTHRLLTDNPPPTSALSLTPPQGYLSVEKISASAPGDRERQLLKQVSFSLTPGDILGVVGHSGCGKSTLARLLLGIWPLSEGIVRLDNADIRQWPKQELGPCLGWLPQECGLIAGTVAQNIARFRQPNPQKVIDAARMAGVHEMILHLPAGYDTLLGDEGAGLSGGQKQRIALARALYDTPRLVVLDEPDASLDDAGLSALMQTLAKLKQQKVTVVLITHRKTMLYATNKLLVLAKGAVAQYGPTQQILAANTADKKPAAANGEGEKQAAGAPAS